MHRDIQMAVIILLVIITVFIFLGWAVKNDVKRAIRVEKNESLYIDKDFDYGNYDECPCFGYSESMNDAEFDEWLSECIDYRIIKMGGADEV